MKLSDDFALGFATCVFLDVFIDQFLKMLVSLKKEEAVKQNDRIGIDC